MGKSFEFLRPYRHILVVGPQRSGTTITAQIIAHDLEKTFVDERQVKGDAGQQVEMLRGREDSCVVQCPAWTYTCHTLGGSEIAVVLVRRPIEEIVASQERIHWTERCQPQELARYGLDSGVISEVKYRVWDERQKAVLAPHGHEVEYHSLAGHSLWIPAPERLNFMAKQTRRNKRNPTKWQERFRELFARVSRSFAGSPPTP